MIFIERRRPAWSREWVIPAGLIWLAVSAIFVAASWRAIAGLALPDADDALRMVEVRDLLAGQGFFDLHQYRVDPPHGMAMHWSRLVDLPLWLIQLLLRPLLGPDLAERAALVLVPLLTLGAALGFAGRLAWRVLGAPVLPYACVVLALLTPAAGQMQPLRIDHHGWQIVCALAALGSLAARRPQLAGWGAGTALALGMTISLELLPLAALFGGVMALRWLREPGSAALLAGYVQALALVGTLAFLGTRGLADLASHCDTLSPAYLAALWVAAAGVSALALLPRVPGWRIAAGLGVIALVAAGTLMLIAPACRAGPFGGLDPLVRQFWYDNVLEGRPVWLQPLPVIAQMIVPPLLGLLASLRLWHRSRGWLREFWCDYALLLGGALMLAVMVARASGFACAFAAVPLGWQLWQWHGAARRIRAPLKRLAALGGMALAVMPALPLRAGAALFPEATSQLPGSALAACDLRVAAPLLGREAPATILAPIDLGPAILTQTRHRVVATAHHRAPAALHDVIAAFIADPAAAQRIVAVHGAGFVAICPGLTEAATYRRAAPHGLMAALADNRPPAWLRPVPMPRQSGLMVWRVVR